MKKFAMAAVAAAALSGGVAHAYSAGQFSNGFVVPNVIFNNAGDTTAVGLINQSGDAKAAAAARAVYWVFFDQDSNHLLDGCFVMTGKESKGFVWGNEASAAGSSNFAGVRGYLVFALGASAADVGTTALVNGVTQFTPTGRVRVPHQTCQSSALLAPEVPAYAAPVTTRDAGGNIAVQRLTAQLSGAAFQVSAATADVQYLPTIPGNLVVNDFVLNGAPNPNNNAVVAAAGLNGVTSNTVDIVKMGPDDLIAVAGAATTVTAAAPGFPQLPAIVASQLSLNVANAAQINLLNNGVATTEMSLRYFIDANKAAGGNDTRLVFWSTGDQRGTYSINAFDNAQNRTSVNLNLLNAELDVVNPETAIAALPASFVDGFIEYTPFVAPNSNGPANVLQQGIVNGQPAAVAVDPKLSTNGGSSFTYSTISSTAFGAVQTILGAHRNR